MDFSVVVPTFNRPDELRGCLEALIALDYPADAYEIVIVDDGGAPPATVATDRCGAVQVRVVTQPNGGPGAARNRGAAIARGRWLAFTDDDCRPEPGWLTGLKPELQLGDSVLAGGATTNLLRTNPYAAASQVIADGAYRHFNRDVRLGRFIASNNMALSRAAFLEAGGFDERFRVASEDRDFCDRWCAAGGRIVWTPHARVGHRHALTFRRFLAQHYRYGRGAAHHYRARAARGRGGMLADFSFRWHPSLLAAPLAASGRPGAVAVLLVCWQLANTAGFVREWASGRTGSGGPPVRVAPRPQ